MTASFSTYFGDYLHGLFITWTSEASNNTGTSELNLRMQMNLRSKLHVYGYTATGSNPSEGVYVDVEATWLNADTELYDVFVAYKHDAESFSGTGETAITTFGDGDVAE